MEKFFKLSTLRISKINRTKIIQNKGQKPKKNSDSFIQVNIQNFITPQGVKLRGSIFVNNSSSLYRGRLVARSDDSLTDPPPKRRRRKAVKKTVRRTKARVKKSTVRPQRKKGSNNRINSQRTTGTPPQNNRQSSSSARKKRAPGSWWYDGGDQSTGKNKKTVKPSRRLGKPSRGNSNDGDGSTVYHNPNSGAPTSWSQVRRFQHKPNTGAQYPSGEPTTGGRLPPNLHKPRVYWPTRNRVITDQYGTRRKKGPHSGVDVRSHIGQPVMVTKDGIVTRVWRDANGGSQIIVSHPDGTTTGYAHTRASVPVGTFVRGGQQIGVTDGSGTGAPHLHHSLKRRGRRVDPNEELRKSGPYRYK